MLDSKSDRRSKRRSSLHLYYARDHEVNELKDVFRSLEANVNFVLERATISKFLNPNVIQDFTDEELSYVFRVVAKMDSHQDGFVTYTYPELLTCLSSLDEFQIKLLLASGAIKTSESQVEVRQDELKVSPASIGSVASSSVVSVSCSEKIPTASEAPRFKEGNRIRDCEGDGVVGTVISVDEDGNPKIKLDGDGLNIRCNKKYFTVVQASANAPRNVTKDADTNLKQLLEVARSLASRMESVEFALPA